MHILKKPYQHKKTTGQVNVKIISSTLQFADDQGIIYKGNDSNIAPERDAGSLIAFYN